MRSLGVQFAFLVLILAVCAGAFFLPALQLDKPVVGYLTAVLSADVSYTFLRSHELRDLYLGSFWIANLFMLASPFGLWRARLGKGGVFVTLMLIWDLLTLSFVVYARTRHEVGSVLIGWCVWEGALVAMTLLLLVVRSQSRHTLGSSR